MQLLDGIALQRGGQNCRRAIDSARIWHEASSVEPRLTISIGVAATIPNAAVKREALVERADLALNRAKQVGRDQVEVEREATKLGVGV